MQGGIPGRRSSHVERTLNTSGGGKQGHMGAVDNFLSFEELYHHTVTQIDKLQSLVGTPAFKIEIEKTNPHFKALIEDFFQPATIQLKLTNEHKTDATKFEKELQVIHKKLRLTQVYKKTRVDSKFRSAHSYNYFGYVEQFIEKVTPLFDGEDTEKPTINANIPFKITNLNITTASPKL